MNRQEIPAKLPGTTVTLLWNFTSDIAEGVTINSNVTTATVYSGTDASPSDLISGIGTASGAIVTQGLTGGVLGVLYELLCTVVCSDGQTLQKTGFLAVVPNL